MDDRHLAYLRAAILLALGSATQAQEATPTPPPADDDMDSIVDEVVVTGTRVTSRTRLESLAPVDVLSQEALTSQGTTELAEALSDAAPSLNFPRPAITDGTDHIRPATLRGLAPDQTLVLVNSKRRHPSALVNVNGSVGRGSAAVDLNALPRNTARTPSPVSSTCACVMRARVAAPLSPMANTTPTSKPNAVIARKPTARR